MHLVNTQTNPKVIINQKEKINCVRMFLEVNYISEICTVNETSFIPGILGGEDCQLNYQTTLPKTQEKRRAQLDTIEKDTENAHTISQDNNKQANKEVREMDQYTQQKWPVAILPRQK